MVSQQTRFHLAAMRLVETVSGLLGTTSYVWGGFTADIYAGRLLREHQDVDYLTVDLVRLKPQLEALCEHQGWATKELANRDLSLRRDGARVQLGNVEVVDSATARWTHNGEQGHVDFPRQWLNPQPVRFCGTLVHVVQPEFSYVMVAHAQMLNPEWTEREKDAFTRTQLQALLEARGVDPGGLCSQVRTWPR